MTVVLITRNLINQFKCLITLAWVKSILEGCCLDRDKVVRCRRKTSSLYFQNSSSQKCALDP